MIKEKKFFTKTTKVINNISWTIVLILLVMVGMAKPPSETFLNRIKNSPVRKSWDLDIMENTIYFLILLFLLCVFSIIINITACKKESYSLKFSPIFLSLSSLLSILFYFIYFYL